MRIGRFALALVGLWAISGPVAVFGSGDDKQCRRDATSEFKSCYHECKDGLQEARDLCHSVDPACADACRAGRKTCKEPFLDTLHSCLDSCNVQSEIEKAACPPKGDPARDACIDDAQLAAFACRDTCKENETVRDGLSLCASSYRDCVKACPAP